MTVDCHPTNDGLSTIVLTPKVIGRFLLLVFLQFLLLWILWTMCHLLLLIKIKKMPCTCNNGGFAIDLKHILEQHVQKRVAQVQK
jgi:hypothetical protein